MDGLHRYPLPRRGFMMSSLISGFTLATTRVDAQAIHTDTTGLYVAEAKVPTSDGELPAYIAQPAAGGPFPIILVVEEIFGVHEYIRDVCRRFAKQGYLAVAAEYYARVGDLSKITNIHELMATVVKAPDAQMMSDMGSVVAWAAANGGDRNRLGINGFCRGGRQTWLYAARSNRLKAAVSWYGILDGKPTANDPRTVLDIIPLVKCPVLGLYGGEDAANPMTQIREAQAEAKQAHVPVEIIIYPDAPHGFHADYRPSYRPEDAKDGWARALAWFRKYGVA
jgi:carboxymethylenebutenolidase